MWSLATIQSMIYIIKMVGIDPYFNVVMYGRGSDVIANLHRFVYLMSYEARKKVAKSLMVLMGNMKRWTRERPDLIRLLLTIMCSSNDNLIESFNSLCSQNLPKNTQIEQRHMLRVSKQLPVQYYTTSSREKKAHDHGRCIVAKHFVLLLHRNTYRRRTQKSGVFLFQAITLGRAICPWQ